MNVYMQATVKAAVGYLKAFKQSIEMASRRDDGQIDKSENKTLKRIYKATDRYIDELTRAIEE